MGVPINYLAVVVAAVANMIIGFLWYGPLFGKQWIRMMGFTKEDIEAAQKKGMGKNYALMALGSLATAYVLAHAYEFAATYLAAFGIAGGAMAGFWNWLGFIAPVMLGSVLWEGKSWKLWSLNAGYYLVALVVMGMIIGGMSMWY